jgi:hypothetical protein
MAGVAAPNETTASEIETAATKIPAVRRTMALSRCLSSRIIAKTEPGAMLCSASSRGNSLSSL